MGDAVSPGNVTGHAFLSCVIRPGPCWESNNIRFLETLDIPRGQRFIRCHSRFPHGLSLVPRIPDSNQVR